jgi:hypothetical protein
VRQHSGTSQRIARAIRRSSSAIHGSMRAPNPGGDVRLAQGLAVTLATVRMGTAIHRATTQGHHRRRFRSPIPPTPPPPPPPAPALPSWSGHESGQDWSWQGWSGHGSGQDQSGHGSGQDWWRPEWSGHGSWQDWSGHAQKIE